MDKFLYEKDDVIKIEREFIKERRKFLGLNENRPFTGIAISGGGIRSSTFSFGFIKILKEKNAFWFDYISTVSGGGYAGSFILQRMKKDWKSNYCCDERAKEYLKNHGTYLFPGKRFLRKMFEKINFISNWFILGFLRLIWFVIFLFLLTLMILFLSKSISIFFNVNFETIKEIFKALGISFAITAAYFYFMHIFRNAKGLWNDKLLFYIFGIISTLFLFIIFLFIYPIVHKYFPSIKEFVSLEAIVILLLVTFLLGFFSNPNILSMHRFYRMRLKEIFLEGKDFYLYEILDKKIPYPLINTTLNILGDKRLAGKISFDFFLLSPLFCGSKLTKYVKTNSPLYKDMHLSTAITISGAALNPMMGVYTNKVLAFLMNLFNLRLGYWGNNPRFFTKRNFTAKVAQKLSLYGIVFWPYYNIAEILGKSTLDRLKINLSDGGHIENLGVFELLRRKCGLILALDAGMDKDYKFEDLKKLILRARNELGIEISFEEDEKPENVIKPAPSYGYSRRNFSVGKIKYDEKNIGIFIYIKTSVTKEAFYEEKKKFDKIKGERNPLYFDYMDYHPDFPHESTLDQFFDPLQWEAYEKLGEDIAKKFLKEIQSNPKYREIKKLLFF